MRNALRQCLFADLRVFSSPNHFTAAMNMAVDEALLEFSNAPSIRFYRWDHPAMSFGYFGRFSDIADHRDQDVVRRWTGGGIVCHGEDLTYGLIVPASDAACKLSSALLYERTHSAIQRTLVSVGRNAELASVAAVSDRRNHLDPAVRDRRHNSEACFANPVRADVMLNGRKIAGAAQRRTRRGVLQQGSIQQVDLPDDFAVRFARELSKDCVKQELDTAALHRADEIAAQRYATDNWLRRR